MEKIFHIATKASGMIAWNVNKKAILIDNDHFHDLVERLLKDQDDGDKNLTMFALRITRHTKLGNERNNDKLQELLNSRLINMLKNGDVNFQYIYTEKDARKNIEDFLEVYKFNTGHAFYAVGRMHDNSDDIINISLRKKPTLFQKIKGVLGDPYKEINILKNEIIKIEGNSFEFTVTLDSEKIYRFNEDGVCSI